MSDKIREEFEAWVEKEAKRRKYAYMDFLLLRDPHSDDYRTTWVDMAWMGWKASRESLVIELPDRLDYTGCSTVIEECKKAIEDAGLKVKP